MTDAHRVAVVGSGFAGLGAAIRLKQAGVGDFVVLERGHDVGGTWRDNTYPGAACDVPSHLYSFSFAPNPRWSRSFSGQREILGYLRGCADSFGVRPHIRFGHEVTAARWDGAARVWRLETTGGPVAARVLVGAMGALSEPALPDVPGLADFDGTLFHTARWDHGHDLRGERVAVIGTGASAIQVVPEIQPLASRVHVFQRTPAWVIPRWDRSIGPAERWLYEHVPAAQRLARAAIYWGRESYVLGFAKDPRLMRVAERLARRHLRRQVPDPVLRAKLTPSFTIGCKRILISNDWYPALTRSNAELVTEPIREVRGRTIVTADGAGREVDAIVCATGFHVTDFPFGRRVHGRDGVSLAEAWRDGMSAYAGTTVAGFPNLFLLTGPNTGLGHTSMVIMIEAQVEYLLGALRAMDAAGADAVEVRAERQAAYDAEVQRRMRGTVWTTGGCASWYLDGNGRNTTLWPGFTWEFRRRTRWFDAGAYELVPAGAGAVARAAAPASVPTT